MSGAEFLLACLVGIMLIMTGAVALVYLAEVMYSMGRLRFVRRTGKAKALDALFTKRGGS